jgi:hypothetical protein
MTAYTYSSFVTALASTMVEDATATDFLLAGRAPLLSQF